MVALGLVLLVLATIFTLGTVFTNGQEATAEVFGISLSGVSVGGLFLAGVVTGAIALLGLFLLLGGTVRQRHKAVERKRARGTTGDLKQENSRLQSELEQERTARAAQPVTDQTYPDTTSSAEGRGSEGRLR